MDYDLVARALVLAGGAVTSVVVPAWQAEHTGEGHGETDSRTAAKARREASR